MILAIDAGNTRIKWGIHSKKWLANGVLVHGEIAKLAETLRDHKITRVVVSNVAGSKVEKAIKAALANTPTLWVKSSAAACGVKNGYDTPEQLGSDRWAALIGARYHTKSACIVASAGTALTVDALSSDGTFLGGIIVPGLAIMQAALSANTQLKPELELELKLNRGELDDFPTNTHDAIVSGALRAMSGAVLAQHLALTLHTGKPPQLLLTGGDAVTLQTLLPEGEIADNLVLQGLILLDKELSA
ncbi:MAG: type III pantothenate kinase [Methylophilaceae bacterium]